MTNRLSTGVRYISAFILLLALIAPSARAQSIQPRYGIGFNTLLSSVDGFGVGLRGRISVPINSDLSIGGDLGFTGFIFQGRRGATWIFDPQLSAIITLLPQGRGATYVMGGIGAYAPVSNQDDSVSGPTIHVGIGRVQVLRETTVFYELNPALIIGLESVNLALPFRAGIIF